MNSSYKLAKEIIDRERDYREFILGPVKDTLKKIEDNEVRQFLIDAVVVDNELFDSDEAEFREGL